MLKFIALVVEEDPLQRTFVADLLKDEGLEVVECASAEAAELVLRRRPRASNGTGTNVRAS
jgi:CheY-like chemotaxis protein